MRAQIAGYLASSLPHNLVHLTDLSEHRKQSKHNAMLISNRKSITMTRKTRKKLNKFISI